MIEQFLQVIWLMAGGIEGLLVVLFFLFFLSAAIPVAPELFAMFAFLIHPTWSFACLILIVATVGDLLGNACLYFLLKRFGMPRFLERLINRYINFIFIKGEKVVLVNRIAPLIPIVAPFMVVCNWSFRRAMWYIAVGGVAKNAVLLILVGIFHHMYDQQLAQLFSLSAFVIIILVSFIIAKQRKSKPLMVTEQ